MDKYNRTKSAIDFYDDLAADYDNMTKFAQRLEKTKPLMEKWHSRFKFSSVLDAACGTGLHSCVLAQMGINTTGADISLQMLEKAKRNATQLGVKVEWIHSSMQDLQKHCSETFDVVFCLGNSLPHLLTKSDLENTLTNFAALLNNNGIFVAQLLNYERLLKNRERIINIARYEDQNIVRFYDFDQHLIQFNILTFRWMGEKVSHKLQSTPLFPYTKEEISDALLLQGFKKAEFYGGMNFESFNEDTSANLVVIGNI
ncbi:MAG: class I SAM-dependent methyltransferase [Calditrichaeota bacterium]|nr:class I SAM-dependent methyltransferase [Calditrichota bacterium]